MLSSRQRKISGVRRRRGFGFSRKHFGLPASALTLTLATGLLPSPALDGIAHAAPASSVASADTPEQRTGTAAGRDHTVGSADTDATGGNEATPGDLAADEDALPLAEDADGFAVVEPEADPVQIGSQGTVETEGPVGFVAGESEELTRERTATTKEFRNPDGTRTTRAYTEAVHFRADGGGWHPIDTSLVPAEDVTEAAPGDPRVSDRLYVAADDSGLSVAEQADDASIAEMGVGGEQGHISFGLADSEGVTGTVDGDTVTYEGVRADADLSIQAKHGMIKETIILNTPAAPRSWTFPLELDGLTPKLDQNGAVLLEDAEGAVQAVIPTAWMEDSSKNPETGGPAVSTDVSYQLQKQDAGWALQVTMGDAWLDDPAREYPVYVDPTVDIESSGDAFVQDTWPDGNFSGDDELKVGSYDGGGQRAYSFLKFSNIDSQLNNRYILNADLGLFNVWSSSCSNHEVRVHQVTEGWSVPSVTWNNRPSVKSGAVGSASFAHGEECGGSAWQTIELGHNGVELVQGWVDGSIDNHGISLRAGFSDSGAWKRFGSRNSANEPYLAITHGAWGAAYDIGSYTEPLTGHQSGEVKVNVKNLGDFTWEAMGWNELRLGARVRDYDSGDLLDAVAFTRLNERVTPDDDTTVNARVPQMPPGRYKVTFDLQRLRDQKWMSSESVPAATITITSQDVGPRLTDVYPQPGGQVGDLTPALYADAETVDHWPAGADLDYWFEICEGTTTEPVNCDQSAWLQRGLWEAPVNMLSWGEQYVWRVQVREADVEGPRSPYYPFTTAVEQPAITSHLGGGGTLGGDGGEADPRIGNYTTTDTDAQVASAGPALTVTRTYNSRDPRNDTAFGAGWSTRYDMRVEPDDDGSGNVVVTYPSGRQVRFGRNPDNSYAPPYGSFATLTRTTDEGWRLIDKAQTDYVFDAQGRITAVTDYRGRKQTMAYDSDRLTTVTGAGGRALNFTWTGGHVAAVTTDPPTTEAQPLTWNYSYAGDRLTQVCGPEDATDACTSYTYGDGSHHRTVIRDAGPFSYWRLGEQAGADQAQSDLLLNRDAHAGTYHDVTLGQAGALAASPDTSASFNGTSSYVRLPDQLVTETPYLTVELWFQTTQHGVLFSYQNHTLEENTTGKYTPALYVGTDGKLRGEFWNGSSAPITSAAPVNDGTWHHAALTAAGNTQTLYLDGEAVGTLSGSISQYDQRFVYLGAGYWNNWPATSGSVGHFSGSIDEAAVYVRPLGARTIAEHHASGSTAQQLTKVTLPSGRVHAEVTYDTALDRVSSYTDANGGTYRLSAYELTGAEGRPASDGDAGAPEDPTVTVTVTDPDDRESSYSYDPLQGHRLIAQTDVAGDTGTFAYDTGGFLAATTAPDGTVTRLGHDERGNKISQTTCRDAGAEETCHTSYTEFFLNPDNPLDPRNDQVVAHRDARSASATDDTYATSYGYNAFGDKVSTTTPATADFPEGRAVTHTFTDGTEAAADGGTVPAGLLATTTDARGGVTSRAYTASGDVARVTDPAGVVTEYTYDALGRELSRTVISDAHPEGVTTTTHYDGESRVVKMTGPVTVDAVTGAQHQAVTALTYDADGRQLSETVSDAAGDDATRTTTRTYDGHGRLATLDPPATDEESYTYDVYGNQISRTMPDGETFTYAYTPLGNLAEVTLKAYDDGSGEPADVVLDSYAYDPAGRLAEHTDAMGRTTRHTYYDDGLLAKKILAGFHDPDGTTRNLVLSERHYDAAGHLISETTGNGSLTVAYDVDAAGRTTAETVDPGGLARRTAYTYDAGGSVLTETRTGSGGTRTERVTYQRNVVGDVVQQIVENGAEDLVTTYEIDDRGLVTAQTSPRGNVTGADPAAHTTTLTYDVLGRLTETAAAPVTVEEYGSQASPRRPVSRTGYNTFGEVTAKQGPNGGVTHTAYDSAGRPVSTTLPAYTPPGASTPQQATVKRTYDAAGRTATEIDPLGNVTTFAHDQLGRLTSVTEPAPTEGAAQPVTRYSYDLLGERLTVTDPTGGRTEATYDELGRQITSTVIERRPAAAAYTTTLTYDDAGNLVSTTSPTGIVTSAGYNTAGQRVSATDTAGQTTTIDYGPTGLPTAVTDPLGRTVRTSHDPAGRTTAITDYAPDGTELRTRSTNYDAAGNPVAVTGPLGHTIRQSFDALGRMSQLVEPVDAETSIITTFGYDAAGQRTRLTDGRANTTWYTFTSRSLPESIIEPATAAHPDAADRTFTTVYDAAGHPVRELQPGGVEQVRTFDALGRIVSATGSGAEAQTGTDSFGYDLAGRVTSLSAPGGTNTYTYDDRGNLLSSAGPSGNATFAYDAEGRLVQRTDAAGTATFGYDGAGRLASSADPLTGTTQAYDYDALSRPAGVTYGTGGATRTFGYDVLGRLASDTLKASDGTTTASVAYGYDKRGQLADKTTTGTAGAGEHAYAYDAAGRIASWTAPDGTVTAYAYDAAGNRVRVGDKSATYDERNRLLVADDTAYTWSARGTLLGTSGGADGDTTAAYDALGRMITSDGITYAYDGLGRVIKRGGDTLQYADRSNNVVDAAGELVSRDPAGNPLATAGADGSGVGAILADQHGDITGTFAPSTGALTGSSAYSPFGKVTDQAGARGSLGYQGEYTDPDSGKVNMHARWYDPSTGAFTSRDSWTLNSSPSIQANRYTYGNGTPLNGTDPTGHFAVALGVGIVFAVAAVTAGVSASQSQETNWPSSSAWRQAWNDQKRGWRRSWRWFTDLGSGNDGDGGSNRDRRKRRQNSTTRHYHGHIWSQPDVYGSSPIATGSPGRGGGYGPGGYGGGGGGGGLGLGTQRPVGPPPPPPPPPWEQILRRVLAQEHAREASVATVDSDLKQFVEDSQTEARKDLELTARELRRYFKLFPRIEDNAQFRAEFKRFLSSWNDNPQRCAGTAGASWAYYHPLDDEGRATGVQACLRNGGVDYRGRGRTADPDKDTDIMGGDTTRGRGSTRSNPAGWVNGDGTRGFARGHLLARQLGGTGRDRRNLVKLHNKSNSEIMGAYEDVVRKRLDVGETVYYAAIPVYEGSSPMPETVEIFAVGDRGFFYQRTVHNTVDGLPAS